MKKNDIKEEAKSIPSGRFFIVNGFDRPCEQLIAEKRDNKLFYIHEPLRDNPLFKNGFSLNQATDIKDFGIEFVISGDILYGQLIRESIARYSDGTKRRWQGRAFFTVNLKTGEAEGS